MILESIAKYLQDNDLGTMEENLFGEEVPIDKNDCVALLHGVSPFPDKALDIFTQDIDFRSRFIRADDGYNKMLGIFNLLHKNQNYEVEGFHVYISYAMGTILPNGRDSEDRHIHSLTVRFIFRKEDD